MGVYIKGMDMPEGCFGCELSFRWYNGTEIVLQCNVLQKLVSDDGLKDPDCPLIELPEPHGRLGDLDRLEQMFADIDNAPYSGFDGTEPFYSAEDAAQIIRLAPTVIPANKGE